jgi:mercuric ion binding protein
MRKTMMKTGLLTLWLACACLFAPVVYAAADVGQQNTIQVATLDIQNMTCPLCWITINKALQNVNGVHSVTVDYDSKTAEVDFDPRQTGVQALIKASTDAGYPATARRTSQ